jgi:DNA topoisomerase-1
MRNTEVVALEQLADPVRSAEVAGLRYVSDAQPGIRRERLARAFRYYHADGNLVRDPETLKRIKGLAIPPAWTRIWICPDPRGHLQATGRDERHRKQYRYHPRWREIRDETKYARMIVFGKALPRIRRQLKRDLALQGLPRRKVLATLVRLLEVSLIRVGNPEYVRQNQTFGLTTLKDRHVEVDGTLLKFKFRGKGKKWHSIDIHDQRLARIVKRCQDLPGQALFQYFEEQGQRQQVDSADVNAYLRHISGEDFTAKDFRTWAGTVLATRALRELKPCGSESEAKGNVVRAIKSVAERLGNTPAICRKCYVHPEVIAVYLEGNLARMLKPKTPAPPVDSRRGLGPEEAAVLRLLQQRLTRRKISALRR